jgi:quinol monooxygenase YgiN
MFTDVTSVEGEAPGETTIRITLTGRPWREGPGWGSMASMIIVAGHLSVEPAGRAAYLATCTEVVAAARSSQGCVDFSIGADLLDPGRVNIYEKWESQAAVDAFRGDGPSGEQGAAILFGSVAEHDVTNVRQLFD